MFSVVVAANDVVSIWFSSVVAVGSVVEKYGVVVKSSVVDINVDANVEEVSKNELVVVAGAV